MALFRKALIEVFDGNSDLQFKIVMSQKQQQQSGGANGNASAGSRRSRTGRLEKGEFYDCLSVLCLM